ncbi:hypothetical protein ACE3NQ_07705 [Paenibacillus terreus]|uniref:Uncharacterized protein n=1 Tax=Paenibacillus terreus TaxID=1387834 RepID=A0ABV5B530_9BACL
MRKKYNTKWAISYKGKHYKSLYGKKNAYDLYTRLSQSLEGLEIVPATKREKKKPVIGKARREYNLQWRANNKDKVKEYNRKYRSRRKGPDQ